MQDLLPAPDTGVYWNDETEQWDARDVFQVHSEHVGIFPTCEAAKAYFSKSFPEENTGMQPSSRRVVQLSDDRWLAVVDSRVAYGALIGSFPTAQEAESACTECRQGYIDRKAETQLPSDGDESGEEPTPKRARVGIESLLKYHQSESKFMHQMTDNPAFAESRAKKGRRKKNVKPSKYGAIDTACISTPGVGRILVGLDVRVFWPNDGNWYSGQIVRYNKQTQQHTVLYYSDDAEETLDLREASVEVMVDPPGTRNGAWYTTRKDDTLAMVAAWFNIPIDKIIKANEAFVPSLGDHKKKEAIKFLDGTRVYLPMTKSKFVTY